MLRRVLLVAVALALPLSACAEKADTAAKYVEGEHYIALKQPVRTSDPTKIEVAEVFWYGCGHCFTFEPMLNSWAKTLPSDVNVVHSPGIWNDRMKLHAQAFYTAKVMKVMDRVHQPIFDALNLKQMPLATEADIKRLFEANGVDGAKFDKVFNSFGVNSQVRQAESRMRSYGIRGTPEIIVNGKYRISTGTAGGQPEMLKVAEYLISKERAARAAPKS